MNLRYYQSEAVDAVWHHLRTRDDNPLVVIPTGGGKTPVIAKLCQDAVNWNGRVLVTAHVKELLEQAATKIAALCVPVGVYSAGLNRRELGHPVTVAGVQSIYRKAFDLGKIDLLIVDECHLIPAEDEGMYRQLIDDLKLANPNLRVVGLTATPYRLKSGSICGPENILNHVCYEIGVRQLISQGFLSRLKSKSGAITADTSDLHVRGGEFVASEVEALMDTDDLVRSACSEIVALTHDRKSVLIFAAGVHHGQRVSEVIAGLAGQRCGFVSGETPDAERARMLADFKAGRLKYLANVNVLTTGFDAPNIDCVVLLRPTMSPGLYYQMVGRGFRLYQGKLDCLVLDYGGNVLRHGPVDAIKIREPGKGDGPAPAKECDNCHALVAAGYSACPECGHPFPPPEREQHEARASSEGILSESTRPSRSVWLVKEVAYARHEKKGGNGPPSMRVSYITNMLTTYREWVCFEHFGPARARAREWWTARSREPVPKTIDEAVELANAGALAKPITITTVRRVGERFEDIVDYTLGPKPERLDNPDAAPELPRNPIDDPEEIPF